MPFRLKFTNLVETKGLFLAPLKIAPPPPLFLHSQREKRFHLPFRLRPFLRFTYIEVKRETSTTTTRYAA